MYYVHLTCYYVLYYSLSLNKCTHYSNGKNGTLQGGVTVGIQRRNVN